MSKQGHQVWNPNDRNIVVPDPTTKSDVAQDLTTTSEVAHDLSLITNTVHDLSSKTNSVDDLSSKSQCLTSKAEELTSVEGEAVRPVREGWILKRGEHIRNWRPR